MEPPKIKDEKLEKASIEKNSGNNLGSKDTDSTDISTKKYTFGFWFSQKGTMCILWIWLILFSLMGLFTFVWDNLYQPLALFKTLILSFSAGGVGASLYSMRMLYYHSHICDDYNKFDINKREEFKWGWGWIWFYWNRPISGAFVGFVTYILILSGFLNMEISNKSGIIAVGIGWLVGYNVTELIQKLEDVASAIFGYKRTQTTFGRLMDLVHPMKNDINTPSAPEFNTKIKQTDKYSKP